MAESILVISLEPPDHVSKRHQKVEKGIALGLKEHTSVIVPPDPTVLVRKSRFGLPKKPVPIVLRFEGDAEGVNLHHGPSRDFREQTVEIPEYTPEDDETEMVQFERTMTRMETQAVRALEAIQEDRDMEALRRADNPQQGPGHFPILQGAVVLLCLVAAFMAYTNNNEGGLSLPTDIRLKAQPEEITP